MHAQNPPSPAADPMAALYGAVIGASHRPDYLRVFARFDAEGRAGASWNWAAYWATLNWLLYRRMWGWAAAYGGALAAMAVLLFGMGQLLRHGRAWVDLLSVGALLAAYVVPGLYANAWFHAHCRRKIVQALRATEDVDQACAALAQAGSPRRQTLRLAAAHALLAGTGLLVWTIGGAETAAPVPPTAQRSVAAPTLRPPAPPPAQAQAAPMARTVTAAPAPAPPAVAQARAAPRLATPPPGPRAVAAPRPWLIQIGAYGAAANARRVQAQLRALGLTVLADEVVTPQGRLLRVRAGPFARLRDAEAAAQRIRALALPALIVRLRR